MTNDISNISNVPQLTGALTTLASATDSLVATKSALNEHMQPYLAVQQEIEKRIADLHDELEQSHSACMEDPSVAQQQDAVDKAQVAYTTAVDAAGASAIAAWETGLSDGRKQWQQDGYGIALRTTRIPVVVDAEAFLEHVERIHASTIVKDVVVKLRKKETMALHEIMPLDGLMVTTSTSCTLKKLQPGL